MDIQALRTELAGHAPAGLNVYDSIPGDVEVPALVVGMPDAIDFDKTFRLAEVVIPLTVLTSPRFDADAESALMSLAVLVAQTYRSLTTGTNYRSVVVDGIRDFDALQVGASESFNGAVVQLTLITPIS